MAAIFSKPKTPTVQAPARMPDPQSAEIEERRKRAREATMSRAGRRSTILSEAGAQGREYTGTTLG